MGRHLHRMCRTVASILFSGVVIGQLANSAAAQSVADKWTTPLATKLGIKLENSYDSSGPDAWDSKKHPLVFITTEGPGYGGLLSGVKLPGLAIFDANSREVVGSKSPFGKSRMSGSS